MIYLQVHSILTSMWVQRCLTYSGARHEVNLDRRIYVLRTITI